MNPRIEQLADRLCEQRLDSADVEALNQLLHTDPDARRQYIRSVHLHAALKRQQRVQGSGFRVQEQAPGRSVGFPALALAAALVLAITAWFLYSPEPRTLNPESSTTTSSSVAMLTDRSDDAVFANTGLPQTLGADLPPGPIRLTAGKAQVMFASTAVVDLIGPCEFEMTGPNRGKLATGRIAAYVPERARGFTLDLPNGGRLVDLGTRFELRVDETGSTLQVFEGRVELHWTSVPGDTQVRTLTPGALVKLIDGRLLPAVIDLDIVNASFERPIVSGRSYVDHLDGWAPAGAAVNGGVNRYGPDFAEAVPDGAQLAFLNAGAIEQTLDSYLAPGVCYTLSLAVGNRPGANSPDYTVELYAGQTLLVAATNPILPSKGRFARAQLVFDCPSDHPALGRPLRIVLRSGGSLATHVQNHFDDIRLTVESSDPQEPPAPEGSANLPPHGD